MQQQIRKRHQQRKNAQSQLNAVKDTKQSDQDIDLFGVFNQHKGRIQSSLDRDEELKYWVNLCCDLKIFDI